MKRKGKKEDPKAPDTQQQLDLRSTKRAEKRKKRKEKLKKLKKQKNFFLNKSKLDKIKNVDGESYKERKKNSRMAKKNKQNKTLNEMELMENQKKEKNLCDSEYKSYFSQFSKHKLKKFQFLDDFTDIEIRNAFRIDKVGNKNNKNMDSVQSKILPQYKLGCPQSIFLQNEKEKKEVDNEKDVIKMEIIPEQKQFNNHLDIKKYKIGNKKIRKGQVLRYFTRTPKNTKGKKERTFSSFPPSRHRNTLKLH